MSQFILALLIAGYFIVRLLTPRASRPLHRVLLTGFLACVALLILLLGLEAALPLYQRLYALFLQTTVLALGIVLLLQFAYRFPQPLSHRIALGRRLAFDRCKWEARLVLALSLLYLGYEAKIAVDRFGQIALGLVTYRVYWADYPMVAGLLWAPIVFVRQSLAASARPRGGNTVRGGVTPPLQRVLRALWRPFRDLIRPQGQAARTARALALVYLLPVAVGLLNVLRADYGIPQDLLQISRSLGMMAALAAFAVIYLNHLPETTSFMVRLVGISLVTLLTVTSAMGWLAAPAYAAQFHAALPDQRMLRFTPNAAGGYDVSLAPFHFESDLGANLHLRDGWDSGRYTAQLHFAFPFYGQTYDRVYANDDGTIALGHEPASFFSYALHYGGATPMLLPLLLDLNPGAAGGDVFARQEADRLIVTWQRVPAFYHPEDVYTFQAALYATGVFEFSYNGLPANLAYRPDDEPSARAWAIGAAPGTSPPAPLLRGTSPPAPLLRGTSPPAPLLRGEGSTSPPTPLLRGEGSTSPPAPLLRGEGSVSPPSLVGKGGGGLGPQHVDFASLASGGTLSGGPQGIVQDYYLDFRRHLHTLLLPLAYLILGASLCVLVVFPALFWLSLVRPLASLLAGVRRANDGDLQVTMPIHYRDEIGFVTESFNRTIAKLRGLVATLEARVAERTAGLTEANVRLRGEIDQRQAAQAQVVLQERALAAAEEREHLGRELHDGLGQVMGYVNVQAQAIRALLQSGQTDPAVSVARQLEQVAQDAHADVRAYILGIRSDAAGPAAGFLAALRLYLATLARTYGFRVTLDLPPSLETNSGMGLFTPEVEAQLLRIVQEALTNVRKHARVTAARVALALEARQAEIVIADAGVGFEIGEWGLGTRDWGLPASRAAGLGHNGSAPQAPNPQSLIPDHFGLAIMAERAQAVGGSVEVASAPGQGTRVMVRMPLALAAEAGVKGLRVLLADDHPLFLDGLRNMLTVHGMNVVGLARDGVEAVEQAVAARPDLILLDIQMPRCDGLEAARRIKAALPATTIVMLTVSATEESLFGALKLGASGYILKSASSEQFFDTLASLLRGEVVFSPEVAALILADLAPVALTPGRGGVTPSLPGLTERQTEVLRLVAHGLTYKEIGARLHVAEVTVKYHIGEILNHLHVQTRKEAVAYAVRSGLDRQ